MESLMKRSAVSKSHDKYDEIFNAVLRALPEDSASESESAAKNCMFTFESFGNVTDKKNDLSLLVPAEGKKKKLRRGQGLKSSRDRLLSWISFYERTRFALWIECSACRKWRRSVECREASRVPEAWHCSMAPGGSCDAPEETMEAEHFTNEIYIPGSVVWAKLHGYPWWPAMIEDDPDSEEYYWRSTKEYHVTFLDEKVSRAWISVRNLRPFGGDTNPNEYQIMNPKYARLVKKAQENAQRAISMMHAERLKNFSFAYTFKGKWGPPIESGDGDSVDETKALLDALDEIGSLNSDSEDSPEGSTSDKTSKEGDDVLRSPIAEGPPKLMKRSGGGSEKKKGKENRSEIGGKPGKQASDGTPRDESSKRICEVAPRKGILKNGTPKLHETANEVGGPCMQVEPRLHRIADDPKELKKQKMKRELSNLQETLPASKRKAAAPEMVPCGMRAPFEDALREMSKENRRPKRMHEMPPVVSTPSKKHPLKSAPPENDSVQPPPKIDSVAVMRKFRPPPREDEDPLDLFFRLNDDETWILHGSDP